MAGDQLRRHDLADVVLRDEGLEHHDFGRAQGVGNSFVIDGGTQAAPSSTCCGK
jgi:hypothetical protein